MQPRNKESVISWVDRCVSALTVRANDGETTPDQLARRPILIGVWGMLLFFSVFLVWGILAPLSSAAVAPGRVIVEGNKKSINHLEGGIIKAIPVTEGQQVEAGDVVLVLDETSAKARLDLLSGQAVAAQATRARLIAERDGKDTVDYPKHLLAVEKTNSIVAQNLESQRRIFASRVESVEGQKKVLGQRVLQFQEEIRGLRAQISAGNQQMSLVQEEAESVRILVGKGLAAKPRLLALERQVAQLRGGRGELTARIARAQQSISEAEIQILNVRTQFLNQVVEELKNTEGQLAGLSEQLRAANDVARRVEITSPIAGTVTGLAVHTVGAAIAPGQALMNIIPLNDNLVVEAKVSLQDIDVVRTGLEAQVRFTAFKQRSVPPLDGKVVNVSADRFDDERTGTGYYKARIEIGADQLALLEGAELTPGMPADTLILTGSRSFFNYLFSPISSSFNHAFREQ